MRFTNVCGVFLGAQQFIDDMAFFCFERLFENLDTLSNDPYVHGWLIKFVTKEHHLLSELLSAQEYAAHISKLHPAAPLKRRKRRSKVIKRKRRK